MVNYQMAGKMYNDLRNDDYSHNAAVAILSNFAHESGLNPASHQQGGGPGRGLAQWERNGRFKDLETFAKKRGASWDDADTQYKFFQHEMQNNYPKLRSQLNTMELPQATEHFMRVYEGPGKPMLDQRLKYANDFHGRFGEGADKPHTFAAGQEGQAQPNQITANNLRRDEAKQPRYAPLSEGNPFAMQAPKYAPLSEGNPFAMQEHAPDKTYKEFGRPSGMQNLTQPLQAVKSMFGAVSPLGQGAPFSPVTGLADAAMRAFPKVAQGVGNEAAALGRATMNTGGKAAGYAMQNPWDAGKQFTTGLADTASAALNTPRNALSISENLGLLPPGAGQQGEQFYNGVSPSYNKFDLGQFLKPKEDHPNAEQQYIRKLGEDIPVLLPAAKAVKDAAKAGVRTMRGGPPDGGGPSGPSGNDTQLHANLEAAEKKFQAADEANRAAKEAAMQSPLKKANPHTMVADFNNNKAKIADIDAKLAEQNEHNTTPAEYIVDNKKQADERLQKAEDTHKEATDHVKEIDKQQAKFDIETKPLMRRVEKEHADAVTEADKFLDKEAEHITRGATETKKTLDSWKKEGTDLYNEVEADAAKKNAVIATKHFETAQEINGELTKMAESGMAESENAMQLYHQLEEFGKQTTMPANAYIRLVKSVKGYMRDAYQKAFENGANTAVQDQWKARARELEAQSKRMEKIMQDSIGKESAAKLAKADAIWRDKVVPLWDAPAYWEIEKYGRMKPDMISSIAGNHKGNVLIQNAIKANPAALKHVVGQRYKNPEAIHKPNEQTKAYTDLVPGLKKFSDQVNSKAEAVTAAKEMVDMQKEATKRSKFQAEERAERTKQHLDENKKAKAEADELNKSYEASMKDTKDLKKQRADLEKVNDLLTDHIKRLNQTANDLRLSRSERKAAKDAIPGAAAKQEKVQGKMKTVLKLAVGLGLGGYGASKALNLLEVIEKMRG